MALESFKGLLYRVNKDNLISFFIRIEERKRTYFTNRFVELYKHLRNKRGWQVPKISAISTHPLVPLQLLTFNETETEE